MKSFLNSIYNILESIGRARSAAALSRSGMHDKAKALLLAD